jgi:hypothetical protein
VQRSTPLFDKPANASVLTWLREQATPAAGTSTGEDGFQIHTHPNIADWFRDLAVNLPVRCDASAFGCPVLVTPAGVIFGYAWGAGTIAFRLPTEAAAISTELDGVPSERLGNGWIIFIMSPHPNLSDDAYLVAFRSCCDAAYRHALSLADDVAAP